MDLLKYCFRDFSSQSSSDNNKRWNRCTSRKLLHFIYDKILSQAILYVQRDTRSVFEKTNLARLLARCCVQRRRENGDTSMPIVWNTQPDKMVVWDHMKPLLVSNHIGNRTVEGNEHQRIIQRVIDHGGTLPTEEIHSPPPNTKDNFFRDTAIGSGEQLNKIILSQMHFWILANEPLNRKGRITTFFREVWENFETGDVDLPLVFGSKDKMLKQMKDFKRNMVRDGREAFYKEIGERHRQHWRKDGRSYYCFEHDPETENRMRQFCQAHDYKGAFEYATTNYVITVDLMRLILSARKKYYELWKDNSEKRREQINLLLGLKDQGNKRRRLNNTPSIT